MRLWVTFFDYDLLGFPHMTLWGHPHDYDIMRVLKTMRLMGYPFKGCSLMTMSLWGYPNDYDITEDPQDNEVNGVPF